MKPSTKLPPLFVACVLLFTHSGGATPAQPNQPVGRLSGYVVDWQYARILDTTITFENKSLKKKVTVDDEGAYEIELPAGTYLVRATRRQFLERRFRFTVEPGKTKRLSLILDVEPEKHDCPKGAICL